MQELVSIIVPVYKVEKYLQRCVDSLLKQTYKNIEIILVDDGSPDDCGKLCDSYAMTDTRVRVIHKANGGLSDARNTALPKASGQYITFVDSDDWVSEFYIEHLYEAIEKENSDLACSWFENIYEGQHESTSNSDVIADYVCLNSQGCLKKLLYQDGVEFCAWGKLYKKEIIADLQYPVGKLYEDIPVTYEYIKRAKKIAIITNVDYFYLQREASIQYQNFSSKKLDGVEHCHEMMEAVKRDFPELSSAAECRYLSTVCNILFQIQDGQYKKEQEILWLEVKKYRKDVLGDKEARKKTRMAALLSYCGYPIMSRTYKMTQDRGGGDLGEALPLISVIIPVYRVENYLRQCVDSVINQTYDHLEIILIDDGSPDNSGIVCDEYAMKDMRVKTYHVPNGGVSCARNYGIERASGDYIFFLDSDDYIEPDCLAVLLAFRYAEGADCTVCAANSIYRSSVSNTSNTVEMHLQVRIATQESAIASLCYMNNPYPGIAMGAIWGCLFNRSVISDERFDNRISIGEDFEFNFRVLQNAEKIVYINSRLYNYRIVSSSVMRNGFDIKKYESVVRLAEKADEQKKYETEFLSRTVNIALVVLLMIMEDGACNEYKNKIEEYIRSKRLSVLRNKKCRIKVRAALALSYFGFPFMKTVFYIAKKES